MTTITVSSGVTSSGLTISASEQLVVLSGGKADACTIENVGSAIVSAGGLMSGGLVDGGGSITASGSVDAMTVEGGLQEFGSGSGLTILGDVGVGANGLEIDATLSGGGLGIGGVASDTKVLGGGHELVLSGGRAIDTLVSRTGVETISAGGRAIDTNVESKGVQVDHGVATGTVVSAGGGQNVTLGGLASAAVLSGGEQSVFGKSGLHSVSSDTVVLSGGWEQVLMSAAAVSTTISAAGSMTVSSGGASSDAVVSSGGALQVGAGGVDSAANIERGGSEVVFAGGLASGAIVHSAGAFVLNGGAEQGAQIYNGGLETITAGGTATGATVWGLERVSSGGVASDTVVTVGVESVLGGGVASGVSLSAAGRLIDDGHVYIGADATFAGAIYGGGSIIVTDGADLMLSGVGSAFRGEATISGGTLELAHVSALGSGRVLFAAGTASETLQIDAADAPVAGGTFANVISNFSGANDFIDLRGITFVSGASATVSGGVLTLTDGGKTYKFTLAGSIGSAFPVTSDGRGGTLIDPRVAGFAQAAAAFAPTAAGPLSPISSGVASGLAEMLHATASAGGRA